MSEPSSLDTFPERQFAKSFYVHETLAVPVHSLKDIEH